MRQFLLVGVVTLLGFFARAQNCRLVLTGHIEDADTKEKLSSATVSIVELQVNFVTDENGDFRYPNICPGVYHLVVSHAGCETIRKVITVVKNYHLDVLMPHLRHNLQEVVVEGQRAVPNNGFRQQVDRQALESSKNFSIADALSQVNGVQLLQTGSTISKPVIHGLHSTRVLTINNGVRQEGQQWGSEHAPEIDTYIADRVSIITGVEALKYGSDAIGGVVLIDPKPVRPLPGYNAEFNTAYSTNNGEYVFSGIFEHQPKKLQSFSYRLQGTLKRAGNVNTPDYRLDNTGMKEENYSLSANWRKEHYQLQAYYSQFKTTIGIFPGSHIGNLTDLLNIIPQPRPNEVFLGEKTYAIERPRQEVLHRLFKLKSSFDSHGHKFNLMFAGQYNHRDEFDIVRSSSNTRPQVSLALMTFNEELSYEHPEFHHINGTIGISLMQQDNSYSGRYLIPNYVSENYGAYWIEKWSRNDWDIEGGLRYDNKNIHTKRLKFNGTRVDHDFTFSTMGTSLNVGHHFSGKFRANINVNLTSRAPYVNELLVDGIHDGAGTYEQGDITLKAEKSFNLSGGFNYTSENKRFSSEVYVYHNPIRDFIYQQPKPEEPVLTIVGAFPKIQYQQTDAMLQGFDVSASYKLIEPLQLTSKFSMLRARNRETNDWLILMPADKWRNTLSYHFKPHGKFSNSYVSAEVTSTYAPRVPADYMAKQDYKAPPGPYTLVNIDVATAVKMFGTNVTIGLGIRNLLDEAYRDYLNSFRYYADEMGRNITVRLKVPFNKFTD